MMKTVNVLFTLLAFIIIFFFSLTTLPFSAQSASSSSLPWNCQPLVRLPYDLEVKAKTERRIYIRFQSQTQNFWCCLAAAWLEVRVAAKFFLCYVCLSNLWMAEAEAKEKNNVSNEEIPTKCRSDEVCVCFELREPVVAFVSLEFIIFSRCWITDLNVKYFYCLSRSLARRLRNPQQYCPRGHSIRATTADLNSHFKSTIHSISLAADDGHCTCLMKNCYWMEFVRYYVKNGDA